MTDLRSDTRDTAAAGRAPDAPGRAPEYVRAIAPYVGGKPIDELARELRLDPLSIVKLASNENPRGPGPRVREAVAAAAAELPRYPDGNGYALKHALAARHARSMDEIVLGNGSNDVLELVAQAFLRPGDETVYSRHAFIVYPLATQARGARGIEVPAHRYGHDLDAMRAAITPKTRIVFVANPNNPTGTWLAAGAIEAFVASIPRDVVVVVDEAYDDYLDPPQRSPAIGWIGRYPHLVVTRTFSKAFGLAGLRVGYGVMDRAVAGLLNRVRQPFNVNALAQAAALAALADTGYVEESRRINREGMRSLEEGFAALGLEWLASRGNFVLVRVGDAMRVYQALLERGVIVRPVANYGLPEWLRVTVGVPAENARFLTALGEALAAARGSADG
ncbi:MAG: histidinol-phosphate transaminase [Proteobacteria bacterium]|jgi:histidinol-phosphate aminotransferase|nr:histidinol-phosphate transaminase [Pseudomonadota bacterium]